ncbi:MULTISPECIES: protein-export chaperone SecB [Latilactobacillus]|uniref:Preprotein translocase subunit SecB n=1 Tax=Latilactobacillus sakei TaxID=1599 RepID=A0AAX0VBE7_LATSK|nr:MULTISPECIES: protein-export chaperone SecB [Latilactobacillus]WAX23779.1 hypothetical protein [Latilactobacillus phage TMW 1.1386 P1]MCP8876499.1 protein-export chaperone SecB [Latilactobacillus curvatus]MDT7016190.1 protein-export chaperone SecB [Latilactobacillus curvatus]MDT7016988.1 protein-export chaperone SecB [Latilactobacillus curvatus]PKX71332.1 hypothetical protein CUR35_08160 [Latilactobacillus sakei]
MKKNPEPYIKLNGYEIEDLNYTNNVETLKSYSEGFVFEPNFSLTKDKLHAKLTVKVSILVEKNSNSKNRGISMTINGFFSISEDIVNDEKKVAQSLIVNGTAILFPYVRSIISMISGLDSAQTVLLPTINTTDLFGN